MPSTSTRPKSTRTSSLLSFYDYGAPPNPAYKDNSVIGGGSSISGGSRVSTPRSTQATPKNSPGPSRTPRRRASQQNHPFEDRKAHSSSGQTTDRPLAPLSPVPVVAEKRSKSRHASPGTLTHTQQVRFDASPEMIEASPDSEYGALPLGVDPDVWRAFLAADRDRSGFIDPSELQTALVNSPWNKPFELATIEMLIGIFDLNKDRAIEFQEFMGLSKYVKDWRTQFEKADRDQSGTIDTRELKKALARFGYNLPLKVVKMLHHKHANPSYQQLPGDGMTFDQFMRACVAVERLARTFEQFNGPRNLQDKSSFENFVIAAVKT